MKIVTTYVAFDDEEFSQMEDCLAYEQHYMDLMVEADECYAMYDKGMNLLPFMYAHNIEEALDEFCRQYNKCDYMIIKKAPSTDAVIFIRDYFGFEMPPRACGLWHYNFREGKWERV